MAHDGGGSGGGEQHSPLDACSKVRCSVMNALGNCQCRPRWGWGWGGPGKAAWGAGTAPSVHGHYNSRTCHDRVKDRPSGLPPEQGRPPHSPWAAAESTVGLPGTHVEVSATRGQCCRCGVPFGERLKPLEAGGVLPGEGRRSVPSPAVTRKQRPLSPSLLPPEFQISFETK